MPETEHKVVHVLFLGFKGLIRLLPRKVCLTLGRILGRTVYCFDKKHRRIALKNLYIAFGEKISRADKKRIAQSSFEHFGKVLFDIIKFSSLSEEKKEALLSMDGEEHVQNALEKGKGALVLTAHYGNWELGIIPISKLGEFNVIARALDIKRLENELLALREGFGAKVIYKQQATRHTLRALKENKIVAILIDQNVLHDQAIFVDFFGKLAGTTPALATFHLRTGAPIIPVFCMPTASRGYHVQLLEGLEFPPTGDHSADVQRITQECTKIIEDQIRDRPEFWLWFHDRWRTQPKIQGV
ncbi:MAG: lysophospholipid acyltransferase family protein [Candidatus Aminicenantaceae bacterium]